MKIPGLILILIFFCGYQLHCQSALSINDRKQICDWDYNNTFPKERKVTFGFGKNKPFLNLTLGPLMYLYQKVLSPQISASCLYNPSCSAFSKELFQHYGILKAFLSTMDRLMRCDRLSATSILPIEIDPQDHKKHETIKYYNFHANNQ